MNRTLLASLAKMFRENGPAAVLTGAGISTESGIPDFRSPGTGLYSRIDPMEYLSIEGLLRNPDRFWKHFAEILGPLLSARPNAGHQALSRLEAGSHVSVLVTQNIDGLHHKAGSRNIIELHGHLRTTRCVECGQSCPMADAIARLKERPRPLCTVCGNLLRPDVVLFGDVPESFPLAARAVRTCGMLLVVGSSLTVHPANTLAHETAQLAIINREATFFDAMAEVVWNAPAGETLEALAQELLGTDQQGGNAE